MAIASRPSYRLRWADPSGAGAERALDDGEIVIGRGASADVRIEDPEVSRLHARIETGPLGVVIRDLNSRNGTYVNDERSEVAELHAGDRVRIGHTVFDIVDEDTPTTAPGATQLAVSSQGATVLAPPTTDSALTERLPDIAPVAATQEHGVVPDELLREPIISPATLQQRGVEVTNVECLTVGGGMGSFQFVDLLRICGLPTSQIGVISSEETPYSRYQRLCLNSQIPPHERLRSNSDSRPDNVWGFPGYAAAEVWRDLGGRRLGVARRNLWSIFGEPALAQTYTPRSGVVFGAIDREMARIGWSAMQRMGRVRAIRKTDDGRLMAIVSASDQERRRHYAVSARYLHMCFGYPAIQLLPDLATFRETYHDRRSVVNAYEEHESIYQQLRQQGGTVLLRGRGIVASRILQRLWEERRHNAGINVVHLHRSRLTEGHRYGRSSREVESEWEFQPFNWPKSCWTGEQRQTLERASDAERKALLEVWGGTTTADRRDWRRIVQEGLRAGWYRPEYGVVKDVRPGEDGRVVTTISNSLVGGGTLQLPADFVIDCTGLVASPERAPVMGDLLETYGLPRNPLGRIAVSNDFEVVGMRHGTARMYAAGATTLGGPHAAVDSFLGVQYAAYRSVHALADVIPALHRLNGLYSLRQWLRWVRGVQP